MKKLILTAAVLALSAPAASALADERRSHRSDHREHRQFHREYERDHRDAHRYGFDSPRGHERWHREYRRDHREFHDDHPRTRHDHRDYRRRSYGSYYGYAPYTGRGYYDSWYGRPGYYGYAPSARWYRGQVLPHHHRRYVVHEYRTYGWAPPPRGYGYYRVDDDVILANLATGVILSVILGR